MFPTPRPAAAAALVCLAMLALGVPTASAAPSSATGNDDDSLVNVSDNNAGPVQACNNDVSTNVLGGQATGSDAAGVVGFDNDHNTSTTSKSCDQQSAQHNDDGDDSTHEDGGEDGDDDGEGSLVNVSDNNAGPVQACNNDVSTNVLGGQAAGSDAAGVVGFDNDHNTSTSSKSCQQDSTQHNDGADEDGDDDGEGSLVNVSDNNAGPVQACNNDVSTNVLGGQGTASGLAGVVGFDNDHNTSTSSKSCQQDSAQHNDNPTDPTDPGDPGDPDGPDDPSGPGNPQGPGQPQGPGDGGDNGGSGGGGLGWPQGPGQPEASNPDGDPLLPDTGGPAGALLLLGLLSLVGGGSALAWRRLRAGGLPAA